jgi:hypothetical protein
VPAHLIDDQFGVSLDGHLTHPMSQGPLQIERAGKQTRSVRQHSVQWFIRKRVTGWLCCVCRMRMVHGCNMDTTTSSLSGSAAAHDTDAHAGTRHSCRGWAAKPACGQGCAHLQAFDEPRVLCHVVSGVFVEGAAPA